MTEPGPGWEAESSNQVRTRSVQPESRRPMSLVRDAERNYANRTWEVGRRARVRAGGQGENRVRAGAQGWNPEPGPGRGPGGEPRTGSGPGPRGRTPSRGPGRGPGGDPRTESEPGPRGGTPGRGLGRSPSGGPGACPRFREGAGWGRNPPAPHP
ncbi:hypothetical protein SMALA_3128 [Streptomyces malaysiensis subsp. malaysiensis]|nr:hypothetical protein SMALA_3128 [Streptomyces malaysiensis]